MKAKNIELSRQWLKKAENDLITAKQTLKLTDGPTDTVCFHSQQAVEKALKALLTFNNVEFPRIHELLRLMDLAKKIPPDLENFREQFAEMSNYAVEVRYPDDWFEPSREDAEQSTQIADTVVLKIKNCLK